ncbi:hypothetical protein NGUA29_00244 [Salmonella enterica]|nr:hypothetical protein NGUA29_00244 [Salmonella enterica]
MQAYGVDISTCFPSSAVINSNTVGPRSHCLNEKLNSVYVQKHVVKNANAMLKSRL